MTRERTRPKSLWRRIERWMVGVAMGVMAFVLEKVVVRAVKKGEAARQEAKAPEPTTLTSRGGEVDL
ncbi:MAG TPA: hypothetical protein VFK59_11100 [Actinomycetota bacterium]|nr:hypothetical protein [Actinomycetota bacterium]